MRNERVKKLAYMGLFLAGTLIISLIENMLPPIMPLIPAVKIGLSNVIILFIYIVFGSVSAFTVLVLRCLLMAIFSGNVFALAFSLPAGIISLLVSMLLLKLNKNSVIMISSLSAIVHNVIQIFIASIVMKTTAVFYYMPYLILIGGICGFLTGLVCYFVIKKMPLKVFLKVNV